MQLEVIIKNQKFKNPIWLASGTFGYDKEYRDFINFRNIGAITTKTVTLDKRTGNPPPRIFETASGILNSIGLPNKGAKVFRQEEYACLKNISIDIIVSIGGSNKKDFISCAKILTENNFPSALELNLSCPNICYQKSKYKLIAQDWRATEQIVKSVRKTTDLPLLVKLSPNVTDIVSIAKAAENSGADAVVLINTCRGLAVDLKTRKPLLGNIIGGLSGPAIKPIALLAVWEVYKQITIPIIGVGGIMTGDDVIEFMLCGARAVQIGTANFIDPNIQSKIFQEFKDYLVKNNIYSLDELVGKLQY